MSIHQFFTNKNIIQIYKVVSKQNENEDSQTAHWFDEENFHNTR